MCQTGKDDDMKPEFRFKAKEVNIKKKTKINFQDFTLAVYQPELIKKT